MSVRAAVISSMTGPGGPFQIEDEDVRGIPMRVYRGGPQTLREVLEITRAFGAKEMLVYDEQRITFEGHYEIVTGFASWMSERGVKKGDRIAIGMRNYPEFSFAFWAAQALGAIVVPLNAWWLEDELKFAIEDSGACMLVLDDERLRRLLERIGDFEHVHTVVSVRAGEELGGIKFDELIATFTGSVLPDVHIDPDDDATILYTSGTTGRPKGAVGSHRNHCTNIINTMVNGAVAAAAAAASEAKPDQQAAAPAPTQPSSLQVFPFFHIGGLSGLYISAMFGVKLVLMYKWDTARALELIERERIQSAGAVPALVRKLLESPELESRDVSSLTNMGSGGAPVPPDLVSRIGDQFDGRVSPGNGYGLTETTSAVVNNSGSDYFAHPESVGQLVPTADIRVVADDGADVAPGQHGELWFRGPNVVRGYWENPAATDDAFTDGWFHTGDVGYVDDDGFVYVVDRIKDVIIRGGENVYCVEVEAVLFEHPDVDDVAVIGLPDPSMGEKVCAVVVPREGLDGVDGAKLQELAASKLARFKVPEVVVCQRDPLPRNATGKVLKRDLRSAYAETT